MPPPAPGPEPDPSPAGPVLLGLGANLPSLIGPAALTLSEALARLAAQGIATVARSRLYASPAWPDPSHPPFLNAVAELATSLPPAELLALCLGIEAGLGRIRDAPNAPRPLDLDLLAWGDTVTPPAAPLRLPHPRIAARAFVLLPLAELRPEWRLPGDGRRVADLVAALPPDHGCAPATVEWP